MSGFDMNDWSRRQLLAVEQPAVVVATTIILHKMHQAQLAKPYNTPPTDKTVKTKAAMAVAAEVAAEAIAEATVVPLWAEILGHWQVHLD
jgi:hypothetical protein